MKHIIDDSDKNKYEAYTKEETLEVIQEAISSGELPEEINGLVLTFKNPIDNKGYKIAFCSQAKYNELKAAGTLEGDCLYYITDDSTAEDLEKAIEELQNNVEQMNEDMNNDIDEINTRLDELGFKEGILGVSGITATENTLIKQGKMCIMNFKSDSTSVSTASVKLTIPDDFLPKENTISQEVYFAYGINGSGLFIGLRYDDTTHQITLTSMASSISSIDISNVGWELE